MKRGDVFMTEDNSTIEVKRVDKNLNWADIRITQPNNVTWSKRQILINGDFIFKTVQLPKVGE